jgi:hypothetical protein
MGEVIVMVKVSNKINKKYKLFIIMFLLFFFAGGICLGLSSNSNPGGNAAEELIVTSDEIKVSPDDSSGKTNGEPAISSNKDNNDRPVEIAEGAGVGKLSDLNTPENSTQPSNSSFEPTTSPFINLEQNSTPKKIISANDNKNDENTGEKSPLKDIDINDSDAPEDKRSEVNEGYNGNDNEQGESPGVKNGDEQSQEPAYISSIYNFGSSTKFALEQNVAQEDFDKTFIVKQNNWEVTEDGSGLSPERGGDGRIFIANEYLNYFVKVFAALNESTLNSEGLPRNDGGYGVMFETGLDENNNDFGFALQFDRGYGNGEIIIREREIRPNSQGNPQTYENSPLYRFRDLPNKNDDPEWWKKEHQLMLEVKTLDSENEAGHNKSLSVSLDEEHLFDWTFRSDIENREDNHVGLRVWHESAKNVEFIGLEIGELPATEQNKEQKSIPQDPVEVKNNEPVIMVSSTEAKSSKEQESLLQTTVEMNIIEPYNMDSNSQTIDLNNQKPSPTSVTETKADEPDISDPNPVVQESKTTKGSSPQAETEAKKAEPINEDY